MWTCCFLVLSGSFDVGCSHLLLSPHHNTPWNNLTCFQYSDSPIVFGLQLNLNHISYIWLKADKEIYVLKVPNKHILLRVSQNTHNPISFSKLPFLLSGSSRSQSCNDTEKKYLDLLCESALRQLWKKIHLLSFCVFLNVFWRRSE